MIGPVKGMGEVLWEATESDQFAVQLMRQVILMRPNGEPEPVAIPRDIRTAQEFDNYLASFGFGVSGNAHLVAACIEPEEMDWFRSVAHHYLTSVKRTSVGETRALMSNLKDITPVPYSFGSRNVPTKTTVQLSPLYYRAIAKIGFHFLLNSCTSLSGREGEFDPLKSFIISGAGNSDQFIKRTNVPKAFTFKRVEHAPWMHIIGCIQSASTITVDIALFANVVVPFSAWEISVPGLLLPIGAGSVSAYRYWSRGKIRPGSGSHGEHIRIGKEGRKDLGIFSDPQG